jgi:hypothetical protein
MSYFCAQKKKIRLLLLMLCILSNYQPPKKIFKEAIAGVDIFEAKSNIVKSFDDVVGALLLSYMFGTSPARVGGTGRRETIEYRGR